MHLNSGKEEFSVPAPVGFAHDGKNDSLLFKTDAQREAEAIRESKRSNLLGDPISIGAKVLYVSRYKENGLLFADAGGACGILLAPCDETQPGERIVLRGHRGPATACVYAKYTGEQDNDILFSCGWDSTIQVWSLDSRCAVRKTTVHEGYVKCMLVYGDNKYLFSSGADAKIRRTHISDKQSLLDVKQKLKIDTITSESHKRSVEAMASVILDGREVLATCSSDSTCRIWDPETLSCLAVLVGHDTNVCDISAYEERIFTASADRCAREWTVDNEKLPWRVKPGTKFEHPDYVRAVIAIRDGSYLVTGASDGVIRIWDLNNASDGSKLLKEVEGHFDEVTHFAIIGGILLSSSLDGTIRRWKINELLDPKHEFKIPAAAGTSAPSLLTADEERELEELMSSSDKEVM